MDIEIQINGKKERQEECNVAELVALRNLNAGSLVVEEEQANGLLIPDGATWNVVVIEIKSMTSFMIQLGDQKKTYMISKFDLVDMRRGDIGNNQWDVLVLYPLHTKVAFSFFKYDPGPA